MSYAYRIAGGVLVGLLAGACSAGAPGREDATSASSASSAAAAAEVGLSFNANWTSTLSGSLFAGENVRVAYDASRLTGCRGDINGHAGWTITGFWRLNGGPIGTFEAGGFSPSNGTQPPVFALTAPGDLEMWFENSSVWGCTAYDSAYGQNYHFRVDASPNAPGWVGNAAYVLERGCSDPSCNAQRQPLDPGYTFGTWARQRAAITEGYFEVWKAGTTDRDNPNLWRDLDVELHTRVGDSGPFAMSYVNFDQRTGNNARYAFSLRDLDPLGGAPGGGALTNKSQCPTFPLTVSADGQFVQADLQFYMTVNGSELRPAAGGVFHGTYQNYKDVYAVCLTP